MPIRLSEATTRHLVILGTPVIIIAGGLIAFESGGYRLAALVLGVVTVALLILSWLFRPRWWGNTRVQAISVTVLGGIAMVVVTDELWLAAFTAFYESLQSAFPEALPVIDFPSAISFSKRLWTLIALGVIFIILNYIWGRQNTLSPPNVSRKENEPFGQKEYEQLRDEYCTYMLRQLDQYDDDLNWSDTDYTRLEAEVEVDHRGNRKPRVEKDLVRAIRRDRTTRAFLLLGDPGSGKSVSLRRLCRQLYGEVAETEIVPVYINLREWNSPPIPTDEDLTEFIKEYMKREAGRAGKKFLDQWYEQMLDAGRFFFLLDSFDELPSVLDYDDASPQIEEISKAFDRFFDDIHQCGGVLASRPSRQPQGFKGQRKSRITIRPLKEIQIRQAMSRWLSGHSLKPTEIIRELFRTRPELVPVIRNPFLADLTSQYLIQHDGKLPPNQFAIYDSFVRHRLSEKEIRLKELGLTEEQVLEAATSIARNMFDEPQAGLEAETKRIQKWIPLVDSEVVIEALFRARLVRLSNDTSRRFSFVHRRFAEFFIVRSLIESGERVPFESIPKDSRWRDCLVVFCGVAPKYDQVRPVADFCWQVIQEQGKALDRRDIKAARPVVHTLRFLRDAFTARPGFLGAFRPQLEEKILRWIRSSNVLAAKIGTECLGLFAPKVRSEGVKAAFKRSSLWVRETAFRASRHLGGSPESEILQHVRTYIRTLPSHRLLRDYRDLAFGLSISEVLQSQLQGLRRDIGWLVVLWFLVLPWTAWLVFSSNASPYPQRFFFCTGILILLLETYLAADTDEQKYSRLGLDTSLRAALLITLIINSSAAWAHISDMQFLLLLIAILPWEFWTGSIELAKIARRHIFESFIIILLLVFVTSMTIFEDDIGNYFTKKVPVPPEGLILDLLTVLILPLLLWFLWEALCTVFGTAIGVMHIVYDMLIFVLRSSRDRHALKRLEIPPVATWIWAHHTCKSLLLSHHRHKFLETLRLRQVELKGDPIPLTDEEWVDDGVREGMVRLELMRFKLDD